MTEKLTHTYKHYSILWLQHSSFNQSSFAWNYISNILPPIQGHKEHPLQKYLLSSLNISVEEVYIITTSKMCLCLNLIDSVTFLFQRFEAPFIVINHILQTIKQ